MRAGVAPVVRGAIVEFDTIGLSRNEVFIIIIIVFDANRSWFFPDS